MKALPPYNIVFSRRKTVGLQIQPDGSLLVRAPFCYPTDKIEALLAKHAAWITEKSQIAKKRMQKEALYAGTTEQIEALRRKARRIIPSRVQYFSDIMKLKPTGIKITSAAKRFGSCSGKNSLCFSWRLMLYPPEAIDYVVVHELAHIAHHDHSPAFYATIAQVLPDYRERERLLKEPLP